VKKVENAKLYLRHFVIWKISAAAMQWHPALFKILAKDFKKSNWKHGLAGYVFIGKSKR
jgi:hypothetical protein